VEVEVEVVVVGEGEVVVVGVDDVVVVVVEGVVAVVVGGGDAGVVTGVVGVPGARTGTAAAFGVDDALPHPAAPSATRASRPSHGRRRHTPGTVAQVPDGAYRAATIERHSSSTGW
jgi:hypothetical protein